MPSPLVDYLKVQKATDQQILRALTASAASIERDLRRLQSSNRIGALARTAQLQLALANIQIETSRAWARVGDVVEAQKAEAAAAAAAGMVRDAGVLSSVFPAADREYMARSAAATATRGLEAVERRLEGSSYVPLAESVYNNDALTSGKIDDIVNAALARGASAAELARDVRDFVNPNTPGGVRYAAMRLGRTEINNSFHASQVKQAQETPWITALRWNLSGSHPVPDECNQYAEEEHFDGGGAGVYRPEDVPGKPHPNCLCFTTPETDDRDEFIRRFEQGDFDTYLDEEFPDLPSLDEAKAAVSPFPGFKRMPEETYAEAVSKANPGTGTEYRNNCHYVTSAMEMRARGYDVVAAPTYKSTGRYSTNISRDWVDPSTGQPRKFQYVVPRTAKDPRGAADLRTVMQEKTADWPPGARGFVEGEWNSGGAHIFSMYKDENGVLRFLDGQVNKKDAGRNLTQMKKIRILRVDDLEPVVDRVTQNVQTAATKVTKESALERAKILMEQMRQDSGWGGVENTAISQMYQHLAEVVRKAGG